VFETLHRLNAELLEDPGAVTASRQASKRFGRYVARSLADGSASAAPIFEEMVLMTEQWLARADALRTDPPTIERRVRATLVTAMAMGIPLLHDHVSREIGADIFEPEGDQLLAMALLDIYSHQLLDAHTAAAVRAPFDEPEAT